jgi:hypothetical protein
MPSKTLLVGLGSKGSDMVSRTLERVFDRNQRPEEVPWLKVVALDTAPISGEPGHEGWRTASTKNVVNIGLDGAEYSLFTERTSELDAIDFSKWADRAVFAQQGASVDGAGGVRMIGRGSLLHPVSMNRLHTALRSRLETLEKIDLTAELAARKLPRLPEGSNPNAIRIFVCGALTGGTASGSFIDLGYLLQAMGAFTRYQVYGIFTIPHPECGKPAPMANAYTAIRELNHFLSDGVRYRQRVALPTHFPEPIAPPLGTTPYRGVMLAMARTGKDSEIEPMHESIAEFLYSAACTNMADSTFQKIVDPAAQYRNLKIRKVHGRFQTLGSSMLVYPAAYIAKGAACLLAANAIEEWLSKPELPTQDGLSELTRMGLDLRNIRQALLQPGSGRASAESEVDKRIDTATAQAIDDHLDYRQTAEAQIEDGFSSSGIVSGTVGARVVPQTIEANKPAVRDRWLEQFRRKIDQSVLSLGRASGISGSDPDTGPRYAIGFCKALIRRLEEIKAETVGSGAQTRVAEARDAMEASWAELEKANNPLAKGLFWARGGRSVLAPRWAESAKHYWHARLEEVCGFAIAECIDEWDRFARRTLVRLQGSVEGDLKDGHNPNCLMEIARAVEQTARAQFDLCDGAKPKLNGYAFFEPGKTILAEQGAAMARIEENDAEGFVSIDPSRKDEGYARAWIIRAWRLLHTAPANPETEKGTFWLTTDEPSVFDQPKNSSGAFLPQSHVSFELEHYLERLIAPAQTRFYRELYSRNVLEALYGHSEQKSNKAEAIVAEIVAKAEPFLKIEDGPPLGHPGPQDPRIPSFAFFLNAGDQTHPQVDFAEQLNANHITNHVPTTDPTRAMVLRTRTTFPAISIQGIDQFLDHERHLGAHEGLKRADGRSPYESRKDVAWRTLDGSPIHDRIRHRMGLVLFGLSISAVKPEANDLIVQTEDPGRRLESDLEKAGLTVCRNITLSAFLEGALRQWAKPSAAAQLAEQIHRFLDEFATKCPRLEYQGVLAQSGELRKTCEELLMELLERDAPDALAAYDRYVNPHEPTPVSYWVDGSTLREDGKGYFSPGYYCPNPSCRAWLAKKGDEELLPLNCPECDQSLFLAGWRRRLKLHDARVAQAGFGGASSGDILWPSESGPLSPAEPSFVTPIARPSVQDDV